MAVTRSQTKAAATAQVVAAAQAANNAQVAAGVPAGAGAPVAAAQAAPSNNGQMTQVRQPFFFSLCIYPAFFMFFRYLGHPPVAYDRCQ